MTIKYYTVTFLCLNLFASAFFWRIIYQHISKKPIISITLVDYIYRDVILYTFFTCAVYSVAIIHTLINDGDATFSLSEELAFLYAFGINIGSILMGCSLIFSAALRLLMIARNNEDTGLLTLLLIIVVCS